MCLFSYFMHEIENERFTLNECAGRMIRPVFATCCKSLLACHGCLEDWLASHDTCPKCRQPDANLLCHVVAGLDEAMDALSAVIQF
jgi:hypothetical protein